MSHTDVVIPPDLQELKQAIGEAILIDNFRGVGREAPESALEAARRGGNVDAAEHALAQFPAQLDDLGRAAERALGALQRDWDAAMDSWMSDLFGSYRPAQSVLTGIPGKYLEKLSQQAFKDEDSFRQVMELFRDLSQDAAE